MALSLPQQLWLKKAYVGDIVEKLRLQVFTIEDLRNFARINPAFSEKLALVETSAKNLEDPEELEDYNAAVRVLSSESNEWQDVEKALILYLERWRNMPSAAVRVAEIKAIFDSRTENARFKALKKSVDIFPETDGGQFVELFSELNAFISDYSEKDYAAADVESCKLMRTEVSEAIGRIAEKQWQLSLDDNGILKNTTEAITFLNKFNGLPEYADKVDDAIWRWAIVQDDVVAGVEEYERIFSGKGRHSSAAAEVYNARSEWDRIDSSNIYDLLEFLDYYPGHIFTEKAAKKLAELKMSELESLRRAPALYDNQTFCALYKRQICTKDELCSACGADDAMFERIISDSKIRATLPAPPGRNSQYAGGKGEIGLTDVILFGVAASGKTCVLSGLLSHDSVTVDEANYSGEYASVLKRYSRAGVAIPGTPEDFIAVVKASSLGKDGRRRSFNIVEMAGEAFSKKIIAAVGRNGRKATDFESMENSASAILTNGNDKLIFLLIDPTCDRFGRQDQIEAFNRLRSLMFDVEANREVMKQVKGLHFIVSKADTLGENRMEKARDIVHEILNPATRGALVGQCRNYGINYSTDSLLNGRPRIFCFSLGKFNVGNIYNYDPKDSGELLSVICDYVDNTSGLSFMRRLRNFLVQPFI